MKNILVFSASENSKQDILSAKYIEEFDPDSEPNPKDFISYNEQTDNYDLVSIARYPHVYSRSGVQSVIILRVTDEQESFIEDLPGAIDILGYCDNDPDNDYEWLGGGNSSINKFKSVVGNKFFAGSGTIGDEDYIAPRKKLAVLA